MKPWWNILAAFLIFGANLVARAEYSSGLISVEMERELNSRYNGGDDYNSVSVDTMPDFRNSMDYMIALPKDQIDARGGKINDDDIVKSTDFFLSVPNENNAHRVTVETGSGPEIAKLKPIPTVETSVEAWIINQRNGPSALDDLFTAYGYKSSDPSTETSWLPAPDSN